VLITDADNPIGFLACHLFDLLESLGRSHLPTLCRLSDLADLSQLE
jgi:hypothetical protein